MTQTDRPPVKYKTLFRVVLKQMLVKTTFCPCGNWWRIRDKRQQTSKMDRLGKQPIISVYVGLDYANCNHWFWFYKYFRIRKVMVSGMQKKSGLLVQVITSISKSCWVS
jgi:hypothetical protein